MTGPGLGGAPTLRSETRLFGPCSLSVRGAAQNQAAFVVDLL